jgi:transposase InsO family protein
VLLEVSRAAYYAHRAGIVSSRHRTDQELTERIRQAHQASKGRYGAPRIHAQLRRRGHRHGRKRVARLMRATGLHGRTPRRFKRTTISDPAAAGRADLIRRDVAVDRCGGQYPLVRRHHLPLDLGRVAVPGDRLEVTLSTGRTGQCWDNALAESFFASLKGECLDRQPWPTRTAARRVTVDYIAWYNGTRLHSGLGSMTPDEFETTTREEPIKQVA